MNRFANQLAGAILILCDSTLAEADSFSQQLDRAIASLSSKVDVSSIETAQNNFDSGRRIPVISKYFLENPTEQQLSEVRQSILLPPSQINEIRVLGPQIRILGKLDLEPYKFLSDNSTAEDFSGESDNLVSAIQELLVLAFTKQDMRLLGTSTAGAVLGWELDGQIDSASGKSWYYLSQTLNGIRIDGTATLVTVEKMQYATTLDAFPISAQEYESFSDEDSLDEVSLRAKIYDHVRQHLVQEDRWPISANLQIGDLEEKLLRTGESIEKAIVVQVEVDPGRNAEALVISVTVSGAGILRSISHDSSEKMVGPPTNDASISVAQGVGLFGREHSFRVSCDDANCYLKSPSDMPIQVQVFNAWKEGGITRREAVITPVSANIRFDMNDFRSHVDAYGYLFSTIEALRAEIPDFDDLCDTVERCAISVDVYSNPSDFNNAVYSDSRISLGRKPNATIHTASDPSVVIHEFMHHYLRFNDRIPQQSCLLLPGEQFSAIEESMADTLALLIEHIILDTDLKGIFGEFDIGRLSLGRSQRQLDNPPKVLRNSSNPINFPTSSLFKRTDFVTGTTFKFKKWTDSGSPQPEHNDSCILDLNCENASFIKYVNMGVPNKLSYLLMTRQLHSQYSNEVALGGRSQFMQFHNRTLWYKKLLVDYSEISRELVCTDSGLPAFRARVCTNFCRYSDLVKDQLAKDARGLVNPFRSEFVLRLSEAIGVINCD